MKKCVRELLGCWHQVGIILTHDDAEKRLVINYAQVGQSRFEKVFRQTMTALN